MLRNRNPWAREEYDRLEALYLEGRTYRKIGERLGRSYNQVRGALDYLGLRGLGRPHPRQRDDWDEIDRIIRDSVEVERMCIPQLVQRLAALGKRVSRESVLKRLKTMPEVHREARANAKTHRATKSRRYWQRWRAQQRDAA